MSLSEVKAQLSALVERMRAEGTRCDTFHATLGSGYKACAEWLASEVAQLPDQEEGWTVTTQWMSGDGMKRVTMEERPAPPREEGSPTS